MPKYEKLLRMKNYFIEMALDSVTAEEKAFWIGRAEKTQGQLNTITLEEAACKA